MTDEESPSASLEFAVITGLSGAGRSEAIRCFEDMGYFCIDNLPPMLLTQLAELSSLPGSRIRKLAVVSDVRGGMFFDTLQQELAKLKAQDINYQILFLEASDNYAGAAERWPDSALEEDALFRAGESQFFADHYVQSNDYFERLLKKYPNSRYLDLVSARRFLIAQYWLKLDADPSFTSVSFDITDKSHPWMDTFGHAVRIFDAMRLDDPTGKLADDATIAAGHAYFSKGKFLKADHYYSDLRTHFPSSEHQFHAHFLGIQAKLKGYLGPDYAGGALDEAETLIKQVRRQFPQQARAHRDELDRAFSEVRYRKAEREWSMAQYYRNRREYGAARFYYDILLQDYSDTPFADRSREKVEAIAGKPLTPPQKMEWLVQLFPETASPQPLIATAPGETKRR